MNVLLKLMSMVKGARIMYEPAKQLILSLVNSVLSVISVTIFTFSTFSCLHWPILLFYSATSLLLSLVLLSRQKCWGFEAAQFWGKIGNGVNSLDCIPILTKRK